MIASDDELGEYEAPVDGTEGVALSLADLFTAAKEAALIPKPTIDEMVLAVTYARGDIEDRQFRLVSSGLAAEPDKPTMRQAMTLAAAANFLMLIKVNAAAVKRVLKGRP